jgi:hypothetical protein
MLNGWSFKSFAGRRRRVWGCDGACTASNGHSSVAFNNDSSRNRILPSPVLYGTRHFGSCKDAGLGGKEEREEGDGCLLDLHYMYLNDNDFL